MPIVTPAPGRPVAAVVTPPGSKSLTNRALLLAALAEGESVIRRPLLGADDAERMIGAIETLGARVRRGRDEVRVTGVGGLWDPRDPEPVLHLGNAGTAVRFMAAAAVRSPVPVTIDGDARMRARPIAELCGALRVLGARVEHLGEPGRVPVRVTAPPDSRLRGATVRLGPTLSGQFISALLLVGPWLPDGITLKLDGPVTSAAYVEMTVGLLHRIGASVRTAEDLRVVRVAGRRRVDGPGGDEPGPPGLGAFDETIEADASGGAPFWAGAAILPGARARVLGVPPGSLQGDADFPAVLERFGAGIAHAAGPDAGIEVSGPATLRPVLADLSRMPDTAMALAVVAAFASGPSVIRGIRTLRVKESDRVGALRAELAKIGVRVESPVAGDEDCMTVTPPAGGVDCTPGVARVEFETYDDHRVAMAMALVGLRRRNVWIRDPGCVRKTYPEFWRDFAAFGA